MKANELKFGVFYQDNPELVPDSFDLYKLESICRDGSVYLHRIVDGHHEASELAWISSEALEEGELIEVDFVLVVDAQTSSSNDSVERIRVSVNSFGRDDILSALNKARDIMRSMGKGFVIKNYSEFKQ